MKNRLYIFSYLIFLIYIINACNYSDNQTTKVINNKYPEKISGNFSLIVKPDKNFRSGESGRDYKYILDSCNNVIFTVNLEVFRDTVVLVLIGKPLTNNEELDLSFYVNDIKFYKMTNNRLNSINIQSANDSFPEGFDLNNLMIFNNKNKDFYNFIDDRIILSDYNFDGFTDLSIYCKANSGSGGEIYFTWVYDSKNEYYKFNTILSSAEICSINEQYKTVVMWWKYGLCEHNTWTYKVEGNEFKLIEETNYYSVTDSVGNVDCIEEIKKY